MAEKFLDDNNVVIVAGEVTGRCEFSHNSYGEKFYMITIKVNRLSDSSDLIPILVSERILDPRINYRGKLAAVKGQFRSYNEHNGEKNRLVLLVFAKEISIYSELPEDAETNNIYLDAYVCKKPIYRSTPLGREITDVLVAVNRAYGKSDYIPCICWGRNAKFARDFTIGQRVQVSGRVQSRSYVKHTASGETEERVAYEVSVATIMTDENAPINSEISEEENLE